MAFINWSSALSVECAVLDEQHKSLIALINDLHTAILRGGAQEESQRIFQELILYTESHFRCEEGMLRQACYPRLVAHHEQHVEFVQRARELYNRSLAERFTVPIDLLVFLKAWLTDHILGTDRQYVACLKTAKIPATARS